MSNLYTSFVKLLKNVHPRVQWFVMIAGVLMPAIVVTLLPKTFHASDVDDFWRWSQAWGVNWRNIYIDCGRCNYPFLGTFLSGGVMHWMGIDNFKDIVAPFRYYLAVVDGLNVLIIYLVLEKLKIANAPLWAGVIGILPSSWVGTSVWGQIDGIGQLLILSTFALFTWFNLSAKANKTLYYLFLIAAGILISCMLLTKQLIIFSLFPLGFMVVVNIFLYSRRPLDIMRSLAVVFISFIAPILVIDSTIYLQYPYFSHLQYVLETGSRHGDIISSFGFNIWIFLVEEPFGSSHIPIDINLGSNSIVSITPYTTGIILFILVNALLLYYFIGYFHKQYKMNVQYFDREGMLILLLHIALVNLSFNLFLTGTHERYLYHFYPFIIMAWLGLFNRKAVYVLLAGATYYGAVLYGYLTRLINQFGQIPYWILGAFHLALYFYLIVLFLRIYRSRCFEEVRQS